MSSVGGAEADEGAPVIDARPGQVLATAVHPFRDPGVRVTEDRIPLIEVFTATWCPPCAPADRALERLLDAHAPGLQKNHTDNGTGSSDEATGRIDVALLAYHPFPDPEGEDPFGIPEGHARMRTKYDAFWFPTVWVDGHLEDGPATRSLEVQDGIEEVHYRSYGNLIEQARSVPPAFTLESGWVRDVDTLHITLELLGTAHVEGPFVVRGVVWEDHLHHRGLNGIEDHRMTVRAMTATQAVPRLAPGETTTLAWDLRVPTNLEFDASGITFIIETPSDDDPAVTPAALMGYAVGTGTLAVFSVFLLRRGGRKRSSPAPTSKDPPPDASFPTEPSPDGP